MQLPRYFGVCVSGPCQRLLPLIVAILLMSPQGVRATDLNVQPASQGSIESTVRTLVAERERVIFWNGYMSAEELRRQQAEAARQDPRLEKIQTPFFSVIMQRGFKARIKGFEQSLDRSVKASLPKPHKYEHTAKAEANVARLFASHWSASSSPQRRLAVLHYLIRYNDHALSNKQTREAGRLPEGVKVEPLHPQNFVTLVANAIKDDDQRQGRGVVRALLMPEVRHHGHIALLKERQVLDAVVQRTNEEDILRSELAGLVMLLGFSGDIDAYTDLIEIYAATPLGHVGIPHQQGKMSGNEVIFCLVGMTQMLRQVSEDVRSDNEGAQETKAKLVDVLRRHKTLEKVKDEIKRLREVKAGRSYRGEHQGLPYNYLEMRTTISKWLSE